MIRWGRGEGETLSINVVSIQCARGLRLGVANVINLDLMFCIFCTLNYNSLKMFK